MLKHSVLRRLRHLGQQIREALLWIPTRHISPFATHVPVWTCLATLYPLRHGLELGSGLISTPMFLNRNVFPDLSLLESLESDQEWLARVRENIGEDSRLQMRYAECIASDLRNFIGRKYDFVFVDNSMTATEREHTILATAQLNVGLTVIHDFEYKPYRDATLRVYPYVFRVTAINPNIGIASRTPLDIGSLKRMNSLIRQHGKFIAPEDAIAWKRTFECMKLNVN